MGLSQGFLNQGRKRHHSQWTKAEKCASLAQTLRRYPDYAAHAILSMGMEWDGKALYNNWANDLEEELRSIKQALDAIRGYRKE